MTSCRCVVCLCADCDVVVLQCVVVVVVVVAYVRVNMGLFDVSTVSSFLQTKLCCVCFRPLFDLDK